MKGKFDKEVITQLLSRFMSGETSLDEEKTLADYFRTHEVEAEWLEYKQMFALFDNGQVDVAGSVRTWHPFRWLAAGIAAGIILLVGLPLLLNDDTAKEKTPVIARQSVSRTSPQPVPQPVAEEKTENAMAEVQLAPQPARQPARKRRETAQGSDDDIQSAPVEEPVMAEESDIQPCFDIDPKMQLYAAEIEMEKSAHQRQAAYEKEMKQRGLELLLYIFADKEENIAHGVVNTQKS